MPWKPYFAELSAARAWGSLPGCTNGLACPARGCDTTSTVSTSTSLSISDDDGTGWGNSDHYVLAYGSWNATTSSAAQRAIACRYPSGESSSAYNNSATHPYVAGFLADLADGTGLDGRMVQEMITMTLADSCKAIFPTSPFPELFLSGSEIWTVGNIYLFTDPEGAYIGARSNGYGLDAIGFKDCAAAVRWYSAQLANGPGGYCGIQTNQSMYMQCRNSGGGQYYTPWPNQLNYQIHPGEVRLSRASASAFRPVP